MQFLRNATTFNTNNTTEYFTRGEFVEAVFGVYNNLIGFTLFAMLMIGLLLVLVYVKTRSAGMVSIVSLVSGSVVASVLPVEMVAFLMFITATTIGALLYALFTGR